MYMYYSESYTQIHVSGAEMPLQDSYDMDDAAIDGLLDDIGNKFAMCHLYIYMFFIILDQLEEEVKQLKATVAEMSVAYEELRCRVQALESTCTQRNEPGVELFPSTIPQLYLTSSTSTHPIPNSPSVPGNSNATHPIPT